MRADELDALERASGVRLPPEYPATIRNCSFAPHHDAAEWSMPADAERSLERNWLARQPSRRKVPWPLTAFVVGEDGSESVHALDLGRSPGVVQEFSLDTGEFSDIAENWPAWLAHLRDALRMPGRGARLPDVPTLHAIVRLGCVLAALPACGRRRRARPLTAPVPDPAAAYGSLPPLRVRVVLADTWRLASPRAARA